MIQKLIEQIRQSANILEPTLQADLDKSRPPDKLTLPDQSFYLPTIHIDLPIFYQPHAQQNSNLKCSSCLTSLTKQKLKGNCRFCGQRVCVDCMPKKRVNPVNHKQWLPICINCQENHLQVQAFNSFISRELAFRQIQKRLAIQKTVLEKTLLSKNQSSAYLKSELESIETMNKSSSKKAELEGKKYQLKKEIQKEIENLHRETLNLQGVEEELSGIRRRILQKERNTIKQQRRESILGQTAVSDSIYIQERQELKEPIVTEEKEKETKKKQGQQKQETLKVLQINQQKQQPECQQQSQESLSNKPELSINKKPQQSTQLSNQYQSNIQPSRPQPSVQSPFSQTPSQKPYNICSPQQPSQQLEYTPIQSLQYSQSQQSTQPKYLKRRYQQWQRSLQQLEAEKQKEQKQNNGELRKKIREERERQEREEEKARLNAIHGIIQPNRYSQPFVTDRMIEKEQSIINEQQDQPPPMLTFSNNPNQQSCKILIEDTKSIIQASGQPTTARRETCTYCHIF